MPPLPTEIVQTEFCQNADPSASSTQKQLTIVRENVWSNAKKRKKSRFFWMFKKT